MEKDCLTDFANTPLFSHGAGTSYTITATPAAIDMGTTDPSITLPSPANTR